MKWKDTDSVDNAEGESPDDYLNESSYPLWEKSKKTALRESFTRTIEVPLILMGAGIVVLIVVFAFSIFGNQQGIDTSQINILEKRIGSLEDRVVQYEGIGGGVQQAETQRVALEAMQERIEKIEAAVALKMEQLSTEINSLQKKTAGSRAVKTTKAQTIKKAANPKYHEVQPGETLYNIGRKYGISVQELIKLNGLQSGGLIHPGQKLVVGSR